MKLNQELVKIAQSAMKRAQEEGMGEEDIRLMAAGALMREARDMGVIGDEISSEMNATLLTVVDQIMEEDHG